VGSPGSPEFVTAVRKTVHAVPHLTCPRAGRFFFFFPVTAIAQGRSPCRTSYTPPWPAHGLSQAGTYSATASPAVGFDVYRPDGKSHPPPTCGPHRATAERHAGSARETAAPGRGRGHSPARCSTTNVEGGPVPGAVPVLQESSGVLAEALARLEGQVFRSRGGGRSRDTKACRAAHGARTRGHATRLGFTRLDQLSAMCPRAMDF